MSVTTRTSSNGEDLTIHIQGRFDFSQHQGFRDSIEKATAQTKAFTVDLAGSEYMDSAALGMLLLLLDKAGNQKSRVRIVNANKDVRKILEIANFDKLFTLA